MRLFDLIEKHNTVGMAAHSLGQLTALLIADISRRRTDQTRYAEFLHILGHVDTDHVLFIVKQGLRQRLGQLGLADARRAEEQEAADWAVRVGDTGAGAQDRVRDLLHGLVLTDDPLMQRVRQAQQLFALTLDQLGDRDTGPTGHDTGDLIIRHTVTQQAGFLLLLGDFFFLLQLLLQGGQLAVLQLAGLGVITGAGSLFDFGLGGLHLGTQALHLVHGVFLVFPLGLLAVEAVAQLSHLFFKGGQTPLGQFIGFLL